MTVLALIVMDEAQKDAATLLDGGGIALGARQINNPLSNNLGHGILLDQWIAPARLLNDPDYVRWVLVLGTLPIFVMDSETLFLPEEV